MPTKTQIREVTGNLFNIYKYAVQMNPEAFGNGSAESRAAAVILFAKADERLVDKDSLVTMILHHNSMKETSGAIWDVHTDDFMGGFYMCRKCGYKHSLVSEKKALPKHCPVCEPATRRIQKGCVVKYIGRDNRYPKVFVVTDTTDKLYYAIDGRNGREINGDALALENEARCVIIGAADLFEYNSAVKNLCNHAKTAILNTANRVPTLRKDDAE